MESLLERIEENRLDALYLFINESLRDTQTFLRFFTNLISVLPRNWSIQRVEVGHEFLGMVPDQTQLFTLLAQLDSLKTLIISDGYVQRKDKGTISTSSLLTALPSARNLTTLDIQRLELSSSEQVETLSEVIEIMNDSLEEVRMTGLFIDDSVETIDPLMEAFSSMESLKGLAIGLHEKRQGLISQDRLSNLLTECTTLQDLSLRSMNLVDTDCETIANALSSSTFLTSLDIRQNPALTRQGYSAILEALEKNYDLWCSVMVDDENFQGRFNALIELNQAGRGDLLRSPLSKEKLVQFLAKISDEPSGEYRWRKALFVVSVFFFLSRSHASTALITKI